VAYLKYVGESGITDKTSYSGVSRLNIRISGMDDWMQLF